MMIKTSVLVATVALVTMPTLASAYEHSDSHAARHYHMLHHGMQGHSVHADGYCNGRVDGSGLRHHCGTATGGVPGGLPNRN